MNQLIIRLAEVWLALATLLLFALFVLPSLLRLRKLVIQHVTGRYDVRELRRRYEKGGW